jgi:hypothetical protein
MNPISIGGDAAQHLNGADPRFWRVCARLEFHAEVEGGPIVSLSQVPCQEKKYGCEEKS